MSLLLRPIDCSPSIKMAFPLRNMLGTFWSWHPRYTQKIRCLLPFFIEIWMNIYIKRCHGIWKGALWSNISYMHTCSVDPSPNVTSSLIFSSPLLPQSSVTSLFQTQTSVPSLLQPQTTAQCLLFQSLHSVQSLRDFAHVTSLLPFPSVFLDVKIPLL